MNYVLSCSTEGIFEGKKSVVNIIFTSWNFHLVMFVLKQSLKGATKMLRDEVSSNSKIVREFTNM